MNFYKGKSQNMTEQELNDLEETLRDIGFTQNEIETYARFAQEGGRTAAQRMLMLNRKRQGTLDEIHFREKQLDRLDYLRHELRKSQAAQI